jgi:hypothetical protein
VNVGEAQEYCVRLESERRVVKFKKIEIEYNEEVQFWCTFINKVNSLMHEARFPSDKVPPKIQQANNIRYYLAKKKIDVSAPFHIEI